MEAYGDDGLEDRFSFTVDILGCKSVVESSEKDVSVLYEINSGQKNITVESKNPSCPNSQFTLD